MTPCKNYELQYEVMNLEEIKKDGLISVDLREKLIFIEGYD
jgi:hypothetical protein